MIFLNNDAVRQQKTDWPDLVRQSLAGNREILDHLLVLLQPYVFNVSQKMLLNPDDAADVTQEVLLRVLLNLQSYEPTRAEFTTWVYAIARNQLLKFRTGKIEALTGSFDQFSEEIYAVADQVIDARELQNPETQLLIKEANVGCMLGMLLCLSREQRMVFIVGEMIGLKSEVGGEICGISAENFRQQLSRARRDLYSFMQNKCGLINKANPCRCHRKTMGFIRAGYVDAKNIRFASEHYKNTRIFSEEQADSMCDMDSEYGQMFRNLPAYNAERSLLTVQSLLNSRHFKAVFSL